VQYIQNTVNKVDIEKMKNNHKGIGMEECWRVIIVMPKDVCMCGHHIWKVIISLICRLSGHETILINRCENDWITSQK
jgi:hypothetical protein